MAEDVMVADSSPAIAAPESSETVEAVVSSPGASAVAETRSIQEQINSLHGKAKEHYMKTGDVKAAQKLMSKKSDVTSGSSPDTAVDDAPKNEADSAPANEQQGDRTPKPKSGQARNFEELRKKAERLEIENRILREQHAVAPASTKPAVEPVIETPVSAEPVRPRMKDFTDPDAYDDAVDKYEKDKRNWDRQEKASVEAQQREQQTTQQAMDGYRRQAKEAEKKYPDFKAVAFREDLPLSHAAVHLIPRLENGADVQYWLGKNPAEAARIAKATEIQGLDMNDPQGHFEKLLKQNNPIAHQVMGMLRAEFSRISATAPSAASPKRNLREVIASSPRPSAEVDVEGSAAPIGDPIKAARAKGDWALANKLQNEKEVRLKRLGAR